MSAVPATALYDRALADPAPEYRLRWADGSVHPLPLEQWLGRLGPADENVLARVAAPVLDIGCGPGRHVAALARRGVLALGVDISPAAVRHARARGATAIERSVFARVPGTGTWRSALLLDGNIGIGGAPIALLDRVRTLLAPGGAALVELEPSGVGVRRTRARLERGATSSAWFPWGRVGVEAIVPLAAAAGLRATETWRCDGRYFSRLEAP
jgi:SAM-dependent methyltransferase